jgi:all-trans-8'-apo-beta-carotenal 15,15'-oxygenase
LKSKEHGGTGSWTGLYRHELDLDTGKVSRSRLSNRGCEFPSINPSNVGIDYQYTYAAASGNTGAWY